MKLFSTSPQIERFWITKEEYLENGKGFWKESYFSNTMI
jgi:hypothetical protein